MSILIWRPISKEKSRMRLQFKIIKYFLHTIPIVRYDKDIKFDYYQKFKSYTNVLAPFADLELANEHGIFSKLIILEKNIWISPTFQKY